MKPPDIKKLLFLAQIMSPLIIGCPMGSPSIKKFAIFQPKFMSPLIIATFLPPVQETGSDKGF
jgi:hypothetical protein